MKLAAFIHSGRSGVGVVDEAPARLGPFRSPACWRWWRRSPPEARRRRRPGRRYRSPRSPFRRLSSRPRNVICVGKNYREHAREFAQSGFEAGAVKGAEIDEFPAVFTKPASCIVGPGRR